jgi:hypothetical protein
MPGCGLTSAAFFKTPAKKAKVAGFDQLLEDAQRGKFDAEMAWAIRRMTLYRLKVIHSADQDTAELYHLETNEVIARGTQKEVEEVLARLVREEAYVGTISALRRH